MLPSITRSPSFCSVPQSNVAKTTKEVPAPNTKRIEEVQSGSATDNVYTRNATKKVNTSNTSEVRNHEGGNNREER